MGRGILKDHGAEEESGGEGVDANLPFSCMQARLFWSVSKDPFTFAYSPF